MINWKIKADIILKVVIGVDIMILLVIFLHTQFQVQLPFPLPGRKLNNPLAILLIACFLRGWVNPHFAEPWLQRLTSWVTNVPRRYYVFGGLLAIQVFLQTMFYISPFYQTNEFFWNLNAEQGYGTHFSVIQLFFLGLLVLIIAGKKNEAKPGLKNTWPWYLVAVMYFFLALDDGIGIHENFINWSQAVGDKESMFHFIHEWLWFYGPVIAIMVLFLIRFFIREFIDQPGAMAVMFAALALWVSVIVLEGLAKNIIDPMGLGEGKLLIGLEEGAEMLGATLFLFGFSQHLIYMRRKEET